MKEKDIIDAYARIRTIDQTIPDDILDFMKDSALKELRRGNTVILGVGDGSGNLYVEGSYEAISVVREKLFEWEKLTYEKRNSRNNKNRTGN